MEFNLIMTVYYIAVKGNTILLKLFAQTFKPWTTDNGVKNLRRMY